MRPFFLSPLGKNSFELAAYVEVSGFHFPAFNVNFLSENVLCTLK
jgi:hypothetical protein